MRVRLLTATALVVLLTSACAARGHIRAAPSPPPRSPATTTVTGEAVFEATAYCQDGKTASGARTQSGIVAADPGILPLGTRIRLRGLKRGHDGLYRVMDTGDHVQGRRIDVFMKSCTDARRFGKQSVRVAILR